MIRYISFSLGLLCLCGTLYSKDDFDLVKTVKDGLVTTHYKFDGEGRIAAKEQCFPEGFQKITYSYDTEGRLSEQTECWGNSDQETAILNFVYDANGNLTKTLIKDVYGILLKEITESQHPSKPTTNHPITSSTPIAYEYTYNLKGLLETITKPDGTVITHLYTDAGQLKDHYASDHSFSYHFIYDVDGNLIKIQDKIRHTETKRSYNSFGHMVSEVLGNGLSLTSTLDSINRRTHLQLPDGSSIGYTYDPVFLRSITRYSKDMQALYHHDYTAYSLHGDILNTSLIGAAGSLSMHYDEMHRCRYIASQHWSEEIPDDGVDTQGNITSILFTDQQGCRQTKFTYDSRKRLASEEDYDDIHSYNYDSRSNRIQDNGLNHTVGKLDQLLSIGDDITYGYDKNGNLTSRSFHKEHTTYRYDALDRLVEVEIPHTSLVHYTYDAFHRRLSKCVSVWNPKTMKWTPSHTHRYIYDGDKEIGAVDESGNIIELRILGLGSMGIRQKAEIGAAVAIELGNAAYAPIHDHRGNVCCLIDSNTGNTAESYRYSAFGTTTVYSSDGSLKNPWQFSSKRLDPETGFVNFGKRYYDPTSARWTTKDPIGDFDGPNPYLYLQQSPLASVDLYGLFSWSSAWQSTKSWFATKSSSLKVLKDKVSYTEHMSEEWDRMSHNTFGEGFLHLAGYNDPDPVETGSSSFGNETSGKVRITLINGILNNRSDLETALEYFSSTHGDTVVHYVFRPTEGWSKDIMNSILAKFGYTTPYAKMLANKWKELIAELGGPESGGVIIHYSHSIGTTDTYKAKELLTPEEQKMIHVISFGAPSLLPNNTGFASAVNYVSRRDGVCLLDPIGYIKGWADEDSNVEFVGTFWGTPMVDHLLYADTYGGIIRDLGAEFSDTYN